MPQRVSFATTQWKDKPGKPSCYTQAQWDARNSSKFNGAPFASPFALTPDSDGKVTTYTKENVDAYKAEIDAIPDCNIPCPRWSGGCQRYYNDEISKIQAKIEPQTVQLNCSEYDMKVWDGSTYFEINAERTFTWTTCFSNQTRTITIGSKLKSPSASSNYYIPVCGPGTHIQEITRQQMIDLVWRIATFELDASSMSLQQDASYDVTSQCWGASGGASGETSTLSAKVKVSATNKNTATHPTPQNESNLVSLNWQSNPDVGYSGKDSMSFMMGSKDVDGNITVPSYSYGPYGTGNGNITVSATATNEYYKCGGGVGIYGEGQIAIKLKSNIQRQQCIYFVADQSTGQEKIYLNILGLIESINLTTSTGGGVTLINNNMGASNILLSHTVNISFLGKTFTLRMAGLPNGTQNNVPISGRIGYLWNWWNSGGTVTTNFTGGTVTITPKKYYPYANSKGEAVYNVDTGAQLKDPLS
jgi:hypothetical protein